MTIKILVLEDMDVRVDWLRKQIVNAKLQDYELAHCRNYDEFVDVAPTDSWDFVIFDHDLEESHYGYGEFSGTGKHAAEFCVQNNVTAKRCIVWSMNPEGATRIVDVLTGHYSVVGKIPFGHSQLGQFFSDWLR